MLSHLLQSNARFPERIFLKDYSSYVFFDVDIKSSAALHFWLEQDAKNHAPNFVLHIYHSADQSFIRQLSSRDNWVESIKEVSAGLEREGDVEGLTMVLTKDSAVRWIAYQLRSIDVGVVAIDCDESYLDETLSSGLFFCCKDINGWLDGNTERDVDLRLNFGTDYLNQIMKNYC